MELRFLRFLLANLGRGVGKSYPYLLLPVLFTNTQWITSFCDFLDNILSLVTTLQLLIGFGSGMAISGVFALTIAHIRQKEIKTQSLDENRYSQVNLC